MADEIYLSELEKKLIDGLDAAKKVAVCTHTDADGVMTAGILGIYLNILGKEVEYFSINTSNRSLEPSQIDIINTEKFDTVIYGDVSPRDFDQISSFLEDGKFVGVIDHHGYKDKLRNLLQHDKGVMINSEMPELEGMEGMRTASELAHSLFISLSGSAYRETSEFSREHQLKPMAERKRIERVGVESEKVSYWRQNHWLREIGLVGDRIFGQDEVDATTWFEALYFNWIGLAWKKTDILEDRERIFRNMVNVVVNAYKEKSSPFESPFFREPELKNRQKEIELEYVPIRETIAEVQHTIQEPQYSPNMLRQSVELPMVYVNKPNPNNWCIGHWLGKSNVIEYFFETNEYDLIELAVKENFPPVNENAIIVLYSENKDNETDTYIFRHPYNNTVHCDRICDAFGGGGHADRGGFTANDHYSTIRKKVLKKIRRDAFKNYFIPRSQS
ncbi:MAG: hypothetical protein KKF44_06030 [Nanoarchaeota archaeon]|nr:hypothetical protein [Nanoarchaeota archaeon]